MKRKLKGFTLVETVIVIAVIAILSAILIPTFGNVIQDASELKYKSEVDAAVEEYYALDGKTDYKTALVLYFKEGKQEENRVATRAYIATNVNVGDQLDKDYTVPDGLSAIFEKVNDDCTVDLQEDVTVSDAHLGEDLVKFEPSTLYWISNKVALAIISQ